MAWKYGQVPTNIQDESSPKSTDERTYSDSKRLSVFLSVAGFMLCSIVVAAIMLWTIGIIKALQKGSSRIPALVDLLDSINNKDFGSVVTVSSSVVTAIAIWQFVIRILTKRVEEESSNLTKLKVGFLNRCRRFIEQYSLWSSGNREQFRSDVRGGNGAIKGWQSANDELKNIKDNLNSFTSRATQLKGSEVVIFVFVIILSSAVLLLGIISEMFRKHTCGDGRPVDVMPFWLTLPLVLLHVLVFLVVQNDIWKYRSLLNHASLGDSSVQPLKYLIRRIEFGSKHFVAPSPGRLRKLKDSVAIKIVWFVTLVAIGIKLTDGVDSRYGTPSEQVTITLFYCVIGLVFPCIIFCSFVVDGSFVRSKISSKGLVNWFRVVVTAFCVGFNLMLPAGSFLIIQDCEDLIWYPWFNPLLSLLAFVILCDLVLCFCSKRTFASVSAALIELEGAASEQLAAIQCSCGADRLSRFGHKKLYFGKSPVPDSPFSPSTSDCSRLSSYRRN
ncbi:hypothetical protein [Brevibacterium sp. HMSC063G07]|uniref:hypothetical protein n=1 Tax=Brevibacterium sp. HMSC063G07 TaxID=1739261 RepID=UPI00114C8A76|nr:hypothetical protein [Brevibacterium sp. HMSC063G07]